jgi:amphi-Trp domain-containing protein
MTLIQHDSAARLFREAAAGNLRELADQLARHNEMAFVRERRQVTVSVPDEVELSIKVEESESEIEVEVEVEISW